MCINLIKDMNEPLHKLNGLLSPMHGCIGQVRERDTRSNGNKILTLNVEQNVLEIVL